MVPVFLEIMRPGNCLMASMAALIADPTPEGIVAALASFLVAAVAGYL